MRTASYAPRRAPARLPRPAYLLRPAGHKRWLLAAAAVLLACPTSALATPTLTRAQQADVNSVVAKAAARPPVATASQAQRDIAAIQPTVDAAIAAGGQPVAQYLVQTTTNPSIAAAVLARYPNAITVTSGAGTGGVGSQSATATTARSRTARHARLPRHYHHVSVRRPVAAPGGPLAHAAACWGSADSQWNWTLWGSEVGWLYTRENGWCGNGTSITWYGGAFFSNWAWGPFCVDDWNTNFSWDIPFSWLHAGSWGSLAYDYGPAGCLFPFNGGHATIRYAANGYWDRYDDYGI